MYDYETNAEPVVTKNITSTSGDLDTSAVFGVGVVTGAQELEQDWSLCVILCCCCGGGGNSGGGGGAVQMKKVG